MNLCCTVIFVINMTNIMSIIMAIILHGIPLMDTHLMLMILIKKSGKLESEEKNSPASSEASVNRNPVDPFQDSQDPYDGYNLDRD